MDEIVALSSVSSLLVRPPRTTKASCQGELELERKWAKTRVALRARMRMKIGGGAEHVRMYEMYPNLNAHFSLPRKHQFD